MSGVNKKILLLGGTGTMGAYLVELLSQQTDVQVDVTSRSIRESKGNIRYIQGNALDNSFLQKLLLNHYDAIVDFMVYKTEVFERRCKMLLDATDQFVYISSARVYADDGKGLTENSPRLLDVCKDADFLKTDNYALAKARQEDILRAQGTDGYTIIRPYLTYSNIRFQMGHLEKEGWLYRAMKGHTVVFPSELLDKKTTLTHGRDVARGICSIIGKNECLGKVYNIVSPQAYTWKEVIEMYQKIIFEETGKVFKIDYTQGQPVDLINTPDYLIEYDRTYNRFFNIEQMKGFVSADNFYSLEEGLRECLHIFLKEPKWKFSNQQWKLEVLRDKFTGEKADKNDFPSTEDYKIYSIYWASPRVGQLLIFIKEAVSRVYCKFFIR